MNLTEDQINDIANAFRQKVLDSRSTFKSEMEILEIESQKAFIAAREQEFKYYTISTEAEKRRTELINLEIEKTKLEIEKLKQ